MRRFLVVSILVALAGMSNAQPVIGLYPQNPVSNFNKNVTVADSATYWVTIQNKGNQNFTGSVAVQTEIDTGAGLTVFQYDSVTIPTTSPLIPNDTLSFPLTLFYYVDPNITTQSQGNIVVIWPVNGVDSFIDTFWVQIGSFVYENPEVFSAVELFPIPASHSVNIRIKRADVAVERVRIFDMNGRLVTDELGAGIMDVSKLSSGRYVVQLQLKSGEIGRYDLVKN